MSHSKEELHEFGGKVFVELSGEFSKYHLDMLNKIHDRINEKFTLPEELQSHFSFEVMINLLGAEMAKVMYWMSPNGQEQAWELLKTSGLEMCAKLSGLMKEQNENHN